MSAEITSLEGFDQNGTRVRGTADGREEAPYSSVPVFVGPQVGGS